MPDLDELEAAANRCARVEQNFCDPNDNSPISRVYDKLWNPDIPQGVSWDRDKRLLANAAPALLSLARRYAKLEGALGEIQRGKIAADNEHPLGEYAGMAFRFHNIAREALTPEDR